MEDIQDSSGLPVEQQDKVNDLERVSEPLMVHDGTCKHEWQFMFKDQEGRFNYKCKHCMFGRASNEEL